jgi:hypothetical protein
MTDVAPKLTWEPLASIRSAPRNPRKHADAAIQASIRAHGFVAPIVLADPWGTVVSGHGRLAALRAMYAAGENPPQGIGLDQVDQQPVQWLVPCRRVTFATLQEAEAYLLAANRTLEAGGWDAAALADTLREINPTDAELTALAWRPEDLTAVLAQGPAGDVGRAFTEHEADGLTWKDCPACGLHFPV